MRKKICIGQNSSLSLSKRSVYRTGSIIRHNYTGYGKGGIYALPENIRKFLNENLWYVATCGLELTDDTFNGKMSLKCTVIITPEKLINCSPNEHNKEEIPL